MWFDVGKRIRVLPSYPPRDASRTARPATRRPGPPAAAALPDQFEAAARPRAPTDTLCHRARARLAAILAGPGGAIDAEARAAVDALGQALVVAARAPGATDAAEILWLRSLLLLAAGDEAAREAVRGALGRHRDGVDLVEHLVPHLARELTSATLLAPEATALVNHACPTQDRPDTVMDVVDEMLVQETEHVHVGLAQAAQLLRQAAAACPGESRPAELYAAVQARARSRQVRVQALRRLPADLAASPIGAEFRSFLAEAEQTSRRQAAWGSVHVGLKVVIGIAALPAVWQVARSLLFATYWVVVKGEPLLLVGGAMVGLPSRFCIPALIIAPFLLWHLWVHLAGPRGGTP